VKGTRFIYLAFGDSQRGYLLDLVRRPDEALVRLALFVAGQPPRVLRQRHPAAAFAPLPGGARLAGWRLDETAMAGELDGLPVTAQLQAAGPQVSLVPFLVGRAISTIPALRSRPVNVLDATVGGAAHRQLAGVLTAYEVGDLARAQWFLIGAQRFDADEGAPPLRCELSAGRLFGQWAVSGYVQIGDRLIRLTSPLRDLLRFQVRAAGEADAGLRRFVVTYRSPALSLTMQAWAPESAFVALEQEGDTTIWTTMFGSCRLELQVADQIGDAYQATGTCLLESKRPAEGSPVRSHP
jgi:hypothetical protein